MARRSLAEGAAPHRHGRGDRGGLGRREAAEAFAVRFTMAYLSFDPSRADGRRQALQPYVADGSDPGMGWDGSGRQTVAAALPSEVTVRDARRSLVTVAALVDGGRWLY